MAWDQEEIIWDQQEIVWVKKMSRTKRRLCGTKERLYGIKRRLSGTERRVTSTKAIILIRKSIEQNDRLEKKGIDYWRRYCLCHHPTVHWKLMKCGLSRIYSYTWNNKVQGKHFMKAKCYIVWNLVEYNNDVTYKDSIHLADLHAICCLKAWIMTKIVATILYYKYPKLLFTIIYITIS